MIEPTDLKEIAALLAGASTTPDHGARAVYLATARAKVEAAAEKLRHLRWQLEAQERELARTAGPTVTTERLEPR